MMTAQEVLNRYWDKKLPVDILSIVKAIGLEAYSLSDEEIAEGVSGRCEIQEGESHSLYVNTQEPLARQRFTLAHELGHYCLEHGSSFRDTRESMYSYDPKEHAANTFAADVLMPKEFVEHYVLEKGLTDISLLSDIFEVSYSAMKIRLERLRLL